MKHHFSIILMLICLTGSAAFSQLNLNFTSRGIGGGGALFSPSINPGDTNEYYISCDMSQLFHSTDFGLNYTQVPFQQFTGGHNSKVCYTSTPNLLYSISYINDTGTLVKSMDGVTWAAITGPAVPADLYSIHVDYANPSRIIVSTYDQIYSSTNGGSNFTLFHNATSGAGNVVGGVFFEGNNIYVGTNDGVLVSTNGGTTWNTASITGLPASERIWSFTAAKSGGITRFFCLTGDASNIYVGLLGFDYYGFCKGIYSCDYGTTNWAKKTTGIDLTTDFPMFIDMAENDINTVYTAGSTDGLPGIMKTVNGGTSWTNMFKTSNNQNISTGWSGQSGDRGWGYGECAFGFDVAANNKDKVIFTDYGFCHKTSNGGTSWQQAYINQNGENAANAPTPLKHAYNGIGLENTTCWQVLWQDANTMWSCFSDIRGIRSIDAGKSWSYNYTHTGTPSGKYVNSTYRIAQGSNGTLYAGTSNIHDMYQSTRLKDNLLDAFDPEGKIIYSADKGLTWQNIHTFNHPVFWIALDPNNANRAYASVVNYGSKDATVMGGVYICDNLSALGSSTWTRLPSPPRTEGHPASLLVLNDGKLVATYSGRINGSFTESSGVFIYTPAGTNGASGAWADVSHQEMRYWTKDIVVDPNDASQNTWYAGVFSGWGGPPNGLGGLYKTIDRGTSWTKLTGETLDRVTSCTFNPLNANEIYITTEAQGLWKSSNINATVPTFTRENGYDFRQPERVFFNPHKPKEMWVSSFGNGMKVANTDNSPLPITLTSFTGKAHPAGIALKWITSSEKNNSRFEILRSADGKEFTVIGSVPGHNNSDAVLDYTYTDTNPFGGTNYYQLRQVDFDSNSSKSDIIAVKAGLKPTEMTISATSDKQAIDISVYCRKAGSGKVLISDITGRKVAEKSYKLSEGYNTMHIPLLQKGIYVVTFTADFENISKKFILE